MGQSCLVLVFFLIYEYSIVLPLFVEKARHYWIVFATLLKDSCLYMCGSVLDSILSVPLIYLSILLLIPDYLDYLAYAVYGLS